MLYNETFINPYELLGLPHASDIALIDAQFDALAKIYNPSVFQGDKEFARKRLSHLKAAFEFLSDENLKREFDQSQQSQKKVEQQPNVDPIQTNIDPVQKSDVINEESHKEFTRIYNNLPSSWEWFDKPYLNGIKPDIVLLSPKLGLSTIFLEYLDLQEGFAVVENQVGNFEIRSETSSKTATYRIPIWKIKLAHLELNRLYGFRLRQSIHGSRQNPPSMTLCLCYPNIEFSAEDKSKLNRFLSQVDGYLLDKSDCADLNVQVSKILPQQDYETVPSINEKTVADLRNWLREPETKRKSLVNFSIEQKRVIENESKVKRRRIRGGPGTGKTEALLGRVGRLSSQGAEVLYLTYNITIINELRLRFSKLEGNRNGNITWLNYHDWCKRISFQFGFESEWSSRFSRADESEEAFEGVGEFILNQISNLKIDDSHKFDALIIDEAQDMSADWIKAALLILRNGGELIIAADTRQDIYNRSQDWTQDQINGLGFRGPWLTLSNSYRTPSYLVPLINNFKERFANNSSHMEGTEPNIVAISNDQLSLDDKLDLFECNNDDLSKKTFEVVHNLIEQDKNALKRLA